MGSRTPGPLPRAPPEIARETSDARREAGVAARGRAEARTGRRDVWPLPIHQLFVRTGVTIFFQGHDHLYARQERDGVIYQSTPNPADPTYTAFNREAYRPGDVLPNSGHLRVSVSPTDVRVDYVRSVLPRDESPQQRDGTVATRYRITASPRNEP
jgi:hypothetical protein